MKKYLSPYILLFLLIGGTIFIFIRVFTLDDQSGSWGLFIESFYWLSLILFISSFFFLLIDFKSYKYNFLVWFHLIISAPLSVIIISNFIQVQYLSFIETTTPKEYRTIRFVESKKSPFLKRKFETIPDSLKNKVIGIRSDSTRRYFLGKTYTDNIDRKLSINLTPENEGLKYLDFKVAELYQSPVDSNYYVGILISKFYNEYAVSLDNLSGIDFESNIFIGSIEDQSYTMLILSKYNLSCSSVDNCLKYMRTNFLKGRSKTFDYNINDIRFWSKNNWIEKIDNYSKDLENNIY